MYSVVVSLIALDIMDASADYNITSSFYYYDGKVFRKYYISNNNGSIKLMNNPVHLPVIIDDPDEDVDDPTDALAVASKCYVLGQAGIGNSGSVLVPHAHTHTCTHTYTHTHTHTHTHMHARKYKHAYQLLIKYKDVP